MNTDKLWLIPLMAFTIVPIGVFVFGLFLTLFAEFFDWLTELWEKSTSAENDFLKNPSLTKR